MCGQKDGKSFCPYFGNMAETGNKWTQNGCLHPLCVHLLLVLTRLPENA